MAVNIEVLKEKLDTKILDLTLLKLSEKRFGTCMSKIAKSKLEQLLNLQKSLDRLLAVQQNYLPEEVLQENITVYNEATASNEVKIKTTYIVYIANCIKEITTVTPTYDEDTETIIDVTSVTLEQDVNCEDPIYENFPCATKLIEQIHSLI